MFLRCLFQDSVTGKLKTGQNLPTGINCKFSLPKKNIYTQPSLPVRPQPLSTPSPSLSTFLSPLVYWRISVGISSCHVTTQLLQLPRTERDLSNLHSKRAQIFICKQLAQITTPVRPSHRDPLSTSPQIQLVELSSQIVTSVQCAKGQGHSKRFRGFKAIEAQIQRNVRYSTKQYQALSLW